VGMTRFWNNKNVNILFRGHDAFLKIFTFLLFQKRVMPTKQDIYVFVIPETRHAHETGYLRFYYSRDNVNILFRGHDAFLE
jgi:calcineurin-like phosphoesterase family protein